MVQAPFEVRVEGYEPDRGADQTAPAVTKADVARDVAVELRRHFDRHPIARDAGPVAADPASAEEIRKVVDDGVRRALRPLEASPSSPYEAELAWMWQVVVAVPLTAFLTSLMTEAGKDAYVALGDLVRRLARAAARRHGPSAPETRTVELRDADSGLTVTLPDWLPDEAYRELVTVTLPPLPDGWDPSLLSWSGDRWILRLWVPIADPPEADGSPWPRKVVVPLVWQAADRRWTLPPDDDAGNYLFMP
jgi:hypothetical protein